MSPIRTIIAIQAPGSHFSPMNNYDEDDLEEEEEETIEDPVDIYERPYQILFDGITEALKLLRAKDYAAAKECLMNAQIEADEAVGE